MFQDFIKYLLYHDWFWKWNDDSVILEKEF
jgi:hypothetical protein